MLSSLLTSVLICPHSQILVFALTCFLRNCLVPQSHNQTFGSQAHSLVLIPTPQVFKVQTLDIPSCYQLSPHIPHFESLPFASCQLPLTCPHPDFTFSHHQMPEPLQILALLCGSIFIQIVAPPILALPASNPASFLIDLSSWPCFDEKNVSSCSVEVSDIASH